VIDWYFNQLQNAMFNFLKRKFKKRAFSFRFGLKEKIKNIFSRKKDLSAFEEFEKLLFEADLGVETSIELVEKIEKEVKKNPSLSTEEIVSILKENLLKYFPFQEDIEMKKPHVMLIMGVNGSGKTTSLIKLANLFKKEGKNVLVVAADTYRAAAVEQLEIWTNKLNLDLIKSQKGADPSSVVYDALKAAKARDVDIVLIDVAGRLHTKTDLMQELTKIKGVCAKLIDKAPHEVLLAIDATTGQNGIDQALVFHEYVPITGIILTKLDGTAKGGVAVALQRKMKIPILWIGTGEKEEDILPFEAKNFIEALLS